MARIPISLAQPLADFNQRTPAFARELREQASADVNTIRPLRYHSFQAHLFQFVKKTFTISAEEVKAESLYEAAGLAHPAVVI